VVSFPTWFPSRDESRDTFFADLGSPGFRSRLGFEGCGSQTQVNCLETLNYTTIWFRKASEIQPVFCLSYLQVRKRKNVVKTPKIEKFKLGNGDKIFTRHL